MEGRMNLFGRMIQGKEEELAAEDDPFKEAGPFRLGSYRTTSDDDFRDVDQMIAAVAVDMERPDSFYAAPLRERQFDLCGGTLTYESAFPDGTANDTVHVEIVREMQTKRAVIIIPHWNTKT